jgi:pimeloyl-ACP methyl ester carboxylesterase
MNRVSGRRVAFVMAAGLIAVAGCSSDDDAASTPSEVSETTVASEVTEPPAETTVPDVTTDVTTAPDGDFDPYAQTLEWVECELGECATATVPIDYDDPSAGDTFIELVRIPASGEAQGTLFVNPGGPGESGVDFAPGWALLVGPEVTAAYDVVGFDPRGVGASDPLECLDTAALDEFIAFDPTPETPEEIDEWATLLAGMGEGCEQDAGALASHVTTVETARDLDVLRAVVGDDQLNYYGASYGTYLGATYAALFPDNVGRLVLDGAVDPEMPFSELFLGYARGFEVALASYADNCVADGACPLGSTPDEVIASVQDLFAQVDEEPLLTSDPDRPITQGLAYWGVVTGLSSAEEGWPLLTEAVLSAQNGDGDLLLLLADVATGRDEEGYSSNLFMAQTAIDCLDTQIRPEGDEVNIDEFVEASPTFGAIVGGFAAYGCDTWPLETALQAPDYSAPGAAPIVVLGTTRDPNTPYAWAQRLAEIIDSGVLLTRDGDGHTGYLKGNACIDQTINEYLVNGAVPDDGTTC